MMTRAATTERTVSAWLLVAKPNTREIPHKLTRLAFLHRLDERESLIERAEQRLDRLRRETAMIHERLERIGHITLEHLAIRVTHELAIEERAHWIVADCELRLHLSALIVAFWTLHISENVLQPFDHPREDGIALLREQALSAFEPAITENTRAPTLPAFAR